MCHICSCFGWTLDIAQQIITFFLACLMVYAICIGLTVAAVAGFAYGYNYSMAEFFTFARPDVMAVIRRNHLKEKPDEWSVNSRRLGSEQQEGGIVDHTKHIQEVKQSSMYNSWQKVDTSRMYAEKLTKYSTVGEHLSKKTDYKTNGGVAEVESKVFIATKPSFYFKVSSRLPNSQTISIKPHARMSTDLWQYGNNQIVMRKFDLISDDTPIRTQKVLEYDLKSKTNGNDEYGSTQVVMRKFGLTINTTPVGTQKILKYDLKSKTNEDDRDYSEEDDRAYVTLNYRKTKQTLGVRPTKRRNFRQGHDNKQ